jgi:hypothetical protein
MKLSDYVIAAGILASDKQVAVIEKLQAAIDAAEPPRDAAMPMYGNIPWDALKAAVGEATGVAWASDPNYDIGHCMTGINMNSLNRIVSKFVAAAKSDAQATDREAGAWRTLMAAAGTFRDGSNTTVELWQDDATCTCGITVGEGFFENTQRFYVERGSFMAAIDQLSRHLAE